MKITDYPAASSLNPADVLVTDGANGTRTIQASNSIFQLMDAAGVPQMHRNLFRGKNLGTAVTAAQLVSIRDGSFKDLWIGDYWVIGGVTYRIVDINYWLNKTDTMVVDPHVVIMPDETMYDAAMHSTGSTTGGYAGSAMHTTNLATAISRINTAFGSAVKTHREYLINAVTSGKPSGTSHVTVTAMVPTERMLIGASMFGVANDGATAPAVYTSSLVQFALFRLAPQYLVTPSRSTYAMQDIVNGSQYSTMFDNGAILPMSAANTRGVRPVFMIG